MNGSLYRNINLYIIFAITLGGIVSVSLLIPVLPAMAAHFSLSPGEIGFMISLYTLPGVLFILFIGILSDKIGRKPILIVSLVLFSVAGGSIYWLDDYKWIMVFRFVQGIGGATLPALSTILIGDLFGEKDRLKVMGLNAAVLSVGTACFPFLGGLLAMDSWNSPFLTFWMGIPLAIFIAIKLVEPKVNVDRDFSAYFKNAGRYIFSARSLFVFSIGLLIFILLYGGVLTYLVLFMDNRFAMSPLAIGIYIAVSSIGSGLIAPLSSNFKRLIGEKLMLVSGFLAFAVSFFLITVISEQLWLLAVFLLIGVGMGITLPLVQSIVTSIAPTEYRGIMVSFSAMTIRGGQTVGPPILALFLLNGDLMNVFNVCFVVSGCFAAILFVWGGILLHNQNTQLQEPALKYNQAD